MIRAILLTLILLSVSACAKIQTDDSPPRPIETAVEKIGWSEKSHRAEIREYIGVDPVRTEWCAAFVNAVLAETGLPGSDQYAEYPLLARSFLDWGVEVDEPESGDVVVFRRGNASWKGHVGFFVTSTYVEGQEYYLVLGGNQNNSVNFSVYPVRKLLSVRRYPL
jgi:uncharacterized protein (TIGR02594 family)